VIGASDLQILSALRSVLPQLAHMRAPNIVQGWVCHSNILSEHATVSIACYIACESVGMQATGSALVSLYAFAKLVEAN
jgi:hypothetical protein